jgi:hypothetical protein
MMDDCSVYVIGRSEGPVKVGISAYPWGRLATLQIGCPFKLELLHTHKARNRLHALAHEEMFHSVYKEYRMIGEWFELDAEAAIEGVDCTFETEEYFEQEARHEYVCAELNIWQ